MASRLHRASEKGSEVDNDPNAGLAFETRDMAVTEVEHGLVRVLCDRIAKMGRKAISRDTQFGGAFACRPRRFELFGGQADAVAPRRELQHHVPSTALRRQHERRERLRRRVLCVAVGGIRSEVPTPTLSHQAHNSSVVEHARCLDVHLARATQPLARVASLGFVHQRAHVDSSARGGDCTALDRFRIAAGHSTAEASAVPTHSLRTMPTCRRTDRQRDEPDELHAGLTLGSMIAVNVAAHLSESPARTSPSNLPILPTRLAFTEMVRTSPGTASARNDASWMPMK